MQKKEQEIINPIAEVGAAEGGVRCRVLRAFYVQTSKDEPLYLLKKDDVVMLTEATARENFIIGRVQPENPPQIANYEVVHGERLM